MEALEIMNHRMLVRFWGRKPYSIAKKLIDSSDSVIVDPFGGSGSIVLTSLEMGKKVIYSDINPYAWLVAHVHIAGADADEFLSAALRVLENTSRIWMSISSAKLPNDYLYYSGAPFLKKRNFERVSEFFSLENRKKLRAILTSIDSVEASPRTKLALYLAFCAALYPASYMKRCGAGSWGVPSYWAPERRCPEDALEAFEKAIRRFYTFFKTRKFYSVCYTLTCDADARILLHNALTIRYRSDWTLVTDPPHADEIQYAELSYFYWAWLKTSRFPQLFKSLTGKMPRLYMSREVVVNERRGKTIGSYLNDLEVFMKRTAMLRKKVLILHEEDKRILEKLNELAKRVWGNIKVEVVEIEEQRNIGPRGSKLYTVIYSI
jgi:hypothetical protein